mmetsp:Transcript_88132/g.251558  ORF Transcript_88132/g.251558 Transcript_88132/m.251558 type:complete len:354 (+) Transcript_88132:98-1159(+)
MRPVVAGGAVVVRDREVVKAARLLHRVRVLRVAGPLAALDGYEVELHVVAPTSRRRRLAPLGLVRTIAVAFLAARGARGSRAARVVVVERLRGRLLHPPPLADQVLERVGCIAAARAGTTHRRRRRWRIAPPRLHLRLPGCSRRFRHGRHCRPRRPADRVPAPTRAAAHTHVRVGRTQRYRIGRLFGHAQRQCQRNRRRCAAVGGHDSERVRVSRLAQARGVRMRLRLVRLRLVRLMRMRGSHLRWMRMRRMRLRFGHRRCALLEGHPPLLRPPAARRAHILLIADAGTTLNRLEEVQQQPASVTVRRGHLVGVALLQGCLRTRRGAAVLATVRCLFAFAPTHTRSACSSCAW